MKETVEGWIPLTRAAFMMRRTWHQTYNMVLSGVIEGRQTETGRWLIRVDSLPQAPVE